MDKQPTYSQYNWSDIQAYLQGNMNTQQMHLLEKQALQDPFLADALEGLGNTPTNKTITDIENLNTQILNQPQPAKMVAIAPKSKQLNWLYISSAVAIFILAFFGVYRLNTHAPQKEIASITSKKETTKPEETIVLADSATSNKNTTKNENTTATSEKQVSVHFNEATAKTVAETYKNDLSKLQQSQTAINKKNEINSITQAEIATAKTKADNETAGQKEATKANEVLNNATQDITAKQESIYAKQNNSDAINLNRSNNWGFTNNIIRGRAITPQGEPVAFATVQVPNTKFQTQTDKLGNFSVPTKSLTDSTVPIQINSIGYDAVNTVANNNSRNYVVLNPSNNALNEVVVTSVGAAKRKEITAAIKSIDISMDTILSPVGGWPAFENYLNSLGYKNSLYDSKFGNGTITKDGTLHSQEVVIEFKADRKGNPTDIQVIQTPSQETASKAIEVLKKGPKWTSSSKKAKAKLAIKM